MKPVNEIQTTDELCDLLQEFCAVNDLPYICATELYHSDEGRPHQRWLADFIERWDDLMEAGL